MRGPIDRVDVSTALGATAVVVGAWPRDDPFFTTLCAMPLIVLGLTWIARRIARRPEAVPHWITASFAVVVLTLPLRRYVGWPQTDYLWAACLLMVLGAFLWHLLPGLRRLLKPGVTRPSRLFFAIPLLAHLAWLPWALEQRQPDGDEPYYLLLTHSLVQDADVELSNNYSADWQGFMDRAIEPQPGDPVGQNGQIYSRHNALMPLALSPFYALAGRLGAAAAMAAMTALLAWLTLKVALSIWPDRGGGALGAWALLAFSPPLTIFSHQIWVEIPAALILMLSLDTVLSLHRAMDEIRRDANARQKKATIIGLVARLTLWLILLPMLKMRFLLVAAPIAVLTYWPLRRRKAWAIGLTAGLTAALGSVLAYNYAHFGNPLKMYSVHEWQLFLSPVQDYLRGAVGMFYDCAFGLFAVAPIWLILLPSMARLAAQRDRYLGMLLWLGGPYFLALAPRLEWYGGWSPAFRYPLVLLPLLALATVPLLDRRGPGVRILVAALGAVTALISLLWLVVPGWTYHLADGGNDLLHRLGWMLDGDLARFFPSTIRPRLATWIWLAVSLLTIPLAFAGGRHLRRIAQRPGAIASGTLLTITLLLPTLVHTVPTTIIHWEDGWIAKRGGRLEPDRWTPVRPSRVGGWMIPSQGELRAPVVPGGDRVRIRLIARREMFGTPNIHVFAGDQQLDVLKVSQFADWEILETEPVDWPAGAPLVLSCPRGPKNQEVGIHVDRIELEWL